MPVTIPATGTGDATPDVASHTDGGYDYQIAKYAADYRSDSYAATGDGTTVDLVGTAGAKRACKSYSLAVKGTGAAATSWTVVLQVSLDGTNWTTILTHDSAVSGEGVAISTGAFFFPGLYFRSKCTAVSLGGASAIVATIVGMP